MTEVISLINEKGGVGKSTSAITIAQILAISEYKILLTLINNPKKIYSREKLLESAIEGYYEKGDRAIDSHIKNLRQKIEEDSRNPKIIQTVYGVGYRFGL